MGRTFRKRKKKRDYIFEKANKNITEGCNWSQLMRWTLQYDVFIKGITTKDFTNTGKGIKATRQIESGTLIISIPRDFLITFDTVWYGYVTKFMQNLETLSVTAKDLFIILLITERRKGEKSKYKYYIKSVPKTYTTLSNIENSEFHLLPLFILEETQKQYEKINRHFDRIQKSLSHFNSNELDINLFMSEVRWAWDVINTRSVYFSPSMLRCKNEMNVSEIDFALAPVLDMLNHSSDAEVEAGFNVERNAYQITTFNSYKPGEQVFINYGAHCNRTLLYEYGFILPNNIHANVPIPEELFFKYFSSVAEPINILLPPVKRKLQKAGVSLEKISCTTSGLDWDFVTAAHVICLQDFSLPLLLSSSLFPEKCQEVCVIVDKSKRLLKHLTDEYVKWIDGINNCKESPSEALLQVKTLLTSEKDILQKTLEQLTVHCMLT